MPILLTDSAMPNGLAMVDFFLELHSTGVNYGADHQYTCERQCVVCAQTRHCIFNIYQANQKLDSLVRLLRETVNLKSGHCEFYTGQQ
jgi:hypothetical protein